jgi:Kef-type K+ transport system membrane component KefB
VLHLPTLLLQVGVILFVARVVGWLLRRIHQPQVIGEMLAGILLGPSLLGWLFPEAALALFPPESLGFLSALSQLGVVLFMFIMGLEVDPQLLRSRGRAAVVTSQAGILVPFVLGSLLGLFLYPRLSDDGVVKAHFVLFMGTAMSITAFPVLARIMNERGLSSTNVGTMALACAAADDVAGWSLLAVVVLLTRSVEVGASLGVILAGLAILGALMWFVARPLLRAIVDAYDRRGFLSNDLMALVLLLVLGAAWGGEIVGVHSLFGAFVLGVLVPRRSDFAKAMIGRIQDLTMVLLLPIFFVLTGLKTRIGLLTGAEMWGYLAAVLLVAIAGKFGGSSLAARMSGLSWREAGAIGVLMNTRGLMELILLNIGLEIGVISPSLFTMMVVMALVTTFMTTPILERIYPTARTEPETAARLLAKAV